MNTAPPQLTDQQQRKGRRGRWLIFLAAVFVLFVIIVSLLGSSGSMTYTKTSASDRPTVIYGTVVSVLEDGIFSKGGLLVDDLDLGIVFVEGHFDDKVDGDHVNVTAVPIGTYKYEAASGAAKTVRAYRPQEAGK